MAGVGRRNYHAELARLEATQPARQAGIWAQLKATLPEYDKLLIGWPAILTFLEQAGVRRPNGIGRVNARQVLRWYRLAGFPLARGSYRPGPFASAPSITSQHACIAWLLSQPEVGRHGQLVAFTCNANPALAGGKPRPRRKPLKFRMVTSETGFGRALEESHGERGMGENAQGGEKPS